MARNCIASIDLEAIKNNYLYAKSLNPKSKAIAIIKANAYGHGAIEVVRYIDKYVDLFGVACIEEAKEILDSCANKSPILLMEGIFDEHELETVNNHNLYMVVYNTTQVEWILKSNFDNKFNIFLKLDSGMGRLGFQENEYEEIITILENSKKINSITMMTHFSCADDIESPSTKNQIEKFYSMINHYVYPKSLSNSAGIIAWREAQCEFTRPGIMLYGSNPLKTNLQIPELSVTMTLCSSLISIKKYKKGQAIGYSGRYICSKDTLIGVVAIGYADGYPRSAKDGTPVFINGGFAKLAGRVSMDMITINLNGISNPKVGDKVELFGKNVSVDNLAKCSDTISNEIYTKITRRVYKMYTR